ncbi:SusC/RagA family TonB-linked outer membrane protein [Flavihumibacter stibioxidans]|uniref:SusC/RagA family TonB-linked outer membrane protein n=1 Tax=Flavihumibacter stibioxidans TaxID=1834163 RepID=UPI0016505082|nr:TonB-dependent receptor [Flavihumibacter stibioxidans]
MKKTSHGGAMLRRPFLLKFARIMKLTALFMLVCGLQVSAGVFSQTKVSLRLEGVNIKKALSTIEKKSSYRFLYNQALFSENAKVEVNVKEEEVLTVLDRLLENSALTYEVLDNYLVVIKFRGVDFQQQQVTGRITNAAGEPLPGASVKIKGASGGTSADADGKFAITVPENATLVISSIGYEDQEVSVAGKTILSVVLKESTKVQDEVVVIGYGVAAKRDLTGTITKIAGKEISDKPNSNPVASLQGKVAGLSIVNSGTPGAEPDIRIRGTVSIGAVKPLYVVDGIFNDNIDYLNPNDIESIEILKDPSSLAIFGIRGASGVIAVTTKKAKAGQVLINFNSSFGTKKLVDKIDMVDAAGFKMLFDEEQANLGITGSDLFNYAPWTGNTDWVDIMTRTATFNNNNLSITGSTDKNRFYMGLGYIVDEGVVKHEKLEKILLNISDEYKVNKNIKLGFTFNGIRQKLPFSQANGLLFDARRVLPITDPFDEASGYYSQLAIQSAQISNPLMNLESKWNKENRIEYRSVGSVYFDLNFLKNFNWRTTLYADISHQDGRTYNPILSIFNPTLPAGEQVFVDPNNRITSVSQNTQSWKKFQQDHILTFKKTFGDHGLTAIGGFTTYFNTYNGLFASARQKDPGNAIPDDKRFWYIDNGFVDQTTRRSSSGQWEKATASMLFRALYNFQGKYMLNASFRRDGSSQISPDNRWKNFYSVGAAWEMTKENFMMNQNIFDFLKLKASWGLLGVQNTYGYDYPFYPGLQTGNTAVFGSNIIPAYSQAYVPNRNLTWEVVDAMDFGFEFYAFKNKLRVEAAYYSKKTRDVMTLIKVGAGAGDRLDNVGKVRNSGIELAAGWNQKIARDLNISINGNFTTYSNKVLFLGNDRIPPSEERPNVTEAGFPIGYFYGYVVEGLYQSYADKLASPAVQGYEYGPGDFKYKDLNGDGIINTEDRQKIGNPTPDFSYGATVSLNYKGFDFGVDINGVYGNEIYRYWGSSELPFTKFNYPAFKLNRWHGEGTSNWDPILGDSHTINRLPSTYGIEDGSYIRIRNVQIGYNFNSDLIRKAYLKNLRIYANVQNLKTFKNNSGYTPEFGGSATSFGIDNGNGPLPMVITGGINLTF